MNEIFELQKAIENYKKSSSIEYGLSRALIQVEKEIEHILFLNLRKQVKNAKESKKIQFGVSENYLEDFINIDIKEPADILCDVRKGIPLNDNSVDFIFSEHFLEHLDYPDSVQSFLTECYRVLDKNARIVIGVPDTKIVLDMYQNADEDKFHYFISKWYSKRRIKLQLNSFIDIVNMHLRDESDSYKYTPHLWAYDFEKLSQILLKHGFRDVRNWDIDKNICNPERIKYTLYVEASK